MTQKYATYIGTSNITYRHYTQAQTRMNIARVAILLQKRAVEVLCMKEKFEYAKNVAAKTCTWNQLEFVLIVKANK